VDAGVDTVNGAATVPVGKGDVDGVVVVTVGIDVLVVVDPRVAGTVVAEAAEPCGFSASLPKLRPTRSRITTTTRPATTWTVLSSSGRRARLTVAGLMRSWTRCPVPARPQSVGPDA
jgi:hypothetical protein